MKKIVHKNKFYLIAALAILCLFLFRSCIYKNNNGQISSSNKTFEQKIVETQNDAVLIVEIANLNLNTLNTLSHTDINQFDGNKEKLTSFKKFNNELNINLNLIATKKLISIPNQYDVLSNQGSGLDLNEDEKNSLSKMEIEGVIKKQLDLFSELQSNTSDVDILEFTIRSKEKLNDIDINI